MWLIIALLGGGLGLLGYWIEMRDRIFAERLADHRSDLILKLRNEAHILRQKLAKKEKQNQSTTKEGPRWKPDNKHHKFLYRDEQYDMWVGEQIYNGVHQLCVIAILMSPPNSTKREWPMSIPDIASLPGKHFGQKTLRAYDYAKENGFLPRYDKPYAKLDTIHFFLGQFHDVDLWYVKGQSEFPDRIVFCHPEPFPLDGRNELKKIYRTIANWNIAAYQSLSPTSAALQMGYDLAADRSLVPQKDPA